jgi:tetratricopeptide (TPR) repeat protein
MRAGNQSEAEAQFHELALAYPSFAGPDINLGILYRKAGRLVESEQALKAATARNSASAPAWNELGVTLRLRGEFAEAAAAYEHAIAADANYAPAHRNLGVVLDLYLGEPERALTEFERYQELSRRREAGQRLDCRTQATYGAEEGAEFIPCDAPCDALWRAIMTRAHRLLAAAILAAAYAWGALAQEKPPDAAPAAGKAQAAPQDLEPSVDTSAAPGDGDSHPQAAPPAGIRTKRHLR